MQRDPISAASFLTQYREACRQTDQLFALVKSDFLTARPVRERHRLLFYIGHLEAFDWNLLSARLFKQLPFAADYDKLFAFGIDPVGGGLPTDQPADWPTMAEIYAYRDAVRARIENAIPDVDFSAVVVLRSEIGANTFVDTDTNADTNAEAEADADADADADAATLLQVAIEHRQMHIETLAYLIHQMPLSQKHIPDASQRLPSVSGTDARVQFDFPANGRTEPFAHRSATASDMVRVDAGDVVVGLAKTTRHSESAEPLVISGRENDHEQRSDGAPISAFGWDNEFIDSAQQRVAVEGFWIDRHMVSNGDFLRFIDAGGYHDAQYWRPEDWAWRCSVGAEHPAFWERSGGTWLLQTMFERRALPADWPVYVSHAEALAYAHFVGKRLPSEAEWMRAALGATQADGPPLEGNFDFRHWDPVPVQAYPRNRSQFGVHGQYGNGWEWTGDRFAPFPGFRAFSFYPGYSADFFDDRHFVMKGGSSRTAARMLRPTFRNWFQPHYPYVYAGFRCVSNQSESAQSR